MTSVLDELPELLKKSIPREEDRKLLKALVVEYGKGGAEAVRNAIAGRVAKIAEANP